MRSMSRIEYMSQDRGEDDVVMVVPLLSQCLLDVGLL